MARRDAPSLILHPWNEDPTKMAVLRAILSCHVRLLRRDFLCWNIGDALAQRPVCFIYPYSLDAEVTELFSGRGPWKY